MPYRKKDELQSGMIVMWSGLLTNIPAGWSICDGTNGTPDLREKFVRGAPGEIGDMGGCNCHSHYTCATTSGISGCGSSLMVNLGCAYPAAAYSHNHDIITSGSVESNLPPYYELIFIRKD